MHPIRRLAPLPLLLMLSGCAPADSPGTQVGVEDSFTCETISSVDVQDLTAIPEGFTLSPRAAIDAAVGTFAGPPLDENEQATAGSVQLTVTDVGGTVVLERYQPVFLADDPGDGELNPALCPPRLFSDLSYTLAADGLPVFAATLETTFTDQAWAETSDSTAFDAALPAPTAFDPSSFEEVESRVVLSGGLQSTWWAYIDWRAWNPSEAAPDGDVAITNESLLMAELSP